MALINYIEPINLGSIFVGVGSLIIAMTVAFLLLRFFKPVIHWLDSAYHKELRYSLLEEKMLDDVAKEKGIDIEVELIKRNVLSKPKKSFRNKIEERVFEKMFPDDKE